ncbi:hypothetical protein TL16_g00237 [Triparma laevis f. inornata]|uniref:Uncharacterized protein n=1 Tax=Triparma laevis f. inornata TaxID=1714386 RepID=A0A9W6Z9K6_9STRA|nr:hypothetical protein TL16_g00237 [Triparma laevis f. inornata]
MATLLTLFPKSRKTLYDSRSLLHSLSTSSHPSPSLLNDTLDELDHQIKILTSLLQNEPLKDREMWSRKISELQSESSSLRQSSKTYTSRTYNPSTLHSQRSYLLSSGESLRNRQQNDYQTRSVEEGVSLDSSLNMVDGMLRQGTLLTNENFQEGF